MADKNMDFTHLSENEKINGIKMTKVPQYIREKAYLTDFSETLAQLAEMIIQLGVNLSLDPDEALEWARKLQESVSQSEFDSWVATLLDGGPSLFFETKAALVAKHPNGAPGVALVRETDPAKIYVWNGSAWEDFGDYQGIELKDGSVTPEKVTFLEETTTNFFNPQNIIDNTVISPSNGSLSTNSSYVTSELIPVVPQEQWTSTRFYYVSFYSDENGTFVSSITLPKPTVITVPTGASFMRVSVAKAQDLNKYILIKGVDISKYGFKLSNLVLNEGTVSVDNVDFLTRVTENIPVDIYDGSTLSEKGYMASTTTGEIVSTEWTTSYYHTNHIPITGGLTYIRKHSNHYVYYDANKQFIKANLTPELITENGITGYGETAPENAAYIIMNVLESKKDDEFLYVTSYDPTNPIFTINSLVIKENQIITGDTNKKAVVSFGDSITGNGLWTSKMSQNFSLDVVNAGFGGTRMVDIIDNPNPYTLLSMVNISEALATNDWTTLDNAVTQIDTLRSDDVYSLSVGRLKDIDFSEIDYITIMYGTNDINSSSISLGEVDSIDTTTVYGALNVILTNIISAFPHLRVFMLTPIFRPLMPELEGNSDEVSRSDIYLYDIANAIGVKAKEYKIPFKNLYYESGINQLNSSYFISDGTHPNSLGDDLLAEVIGRFITTN